MMRYAMDQLRREGVPEQHLRQSAAHLVGQAHMESGLNPNAVHDRGMGYGIYGARDPSPGRGRRTSMLNWLIANGYARNSAEGQMRYMVHEAMNVGTYRRTRDILIGRGTGNIEFDTNAITKHFESPTVVNRRSGAVQAAMRIGPSEPTAGRQAESSPDAPCAERPGPGGYYKSRDGGYSRRRDEDVVVDAAPKRLGDEMMKRHFGRDLHGEISPTSGKESLHITMDGMPPGTRARASMDDLFKDVAITQRRQVDSSIKGPR